MAEEFPDGERKEAPPEDYSGDETAVLHLPVDPAFAELQTKVNDPTAAVSLLLQEQDPAAVTVNVLVGWSGWMGAEPKATNEQLGAIFVELCRRNWQVAQEAVTSIMSMHGVQPLISSLLHTLARTITYYPFEQILPIQDPVWIAGLLAEWHDSKAAAVILGKLGDTQIAVLDALLASIRR
jgi:hypothetical protein